MLGFLQCYMLVTSFLQPMKQEWTGFLFSKAGIPDDQSSLMHNMCRYSEKTSGADTQTKLHSLCSTQPGGARSLCIKHDVV